MKQQLGEIQPLPTCSQRLLLAVGTPPDIVEDLTAICTDQWIEIGPLQLVPICNLLEQNEPFPACSENGYIVLAGAANGDPVALHGESRRIVYFSLELLFSNLNWTECLHPSPFLYEDFWEAAMIQEDFPWDAYEAKRQWP